MTVEGVLATDYYSLYPFAKKSLKIGFSKYGEMINGKENLGIEYGGEVDPFAAPAGPGVGSIPKIMWFQGWYIDIRYVHATWGPRTVWAGAMFSDGQGYGGPWLRVEFTNDWSPTYGWEDFRDPGYQYNLDPNNPASYGSLEHSGRKTNGTAITEPIQVLYHGPRKFVAIVSTTIYDYNEEAMNESVPLVKVTFTIIFEKVKKQVIILKDIKSLLPEKTGTKMKIQFSNRGEVDLGNEEVGYHSFFHFYTIGTGPYDKEPLAVTTVYNSSWTTTKTENPEDTSYPGYSAAGPFPQDQLATSYGMTNNPAVATFDVFQALNNESGHVFWAAFWPSLSDWCADSWSGAANVWWRAMSASDPHYIDGAPGLGEPRIPFYVGEWDFVLWSPAYVTYGYPIQFRAVTVYGVTDWDEADDADMGRGHVNVLEDEALNYQLKQVFWPWDLLKVSYKDTARLVNFFTGDGSNKDFYLYWPDGIRLNGTKPIWSGVFWYVPDSMWDDYSVFAERVLVDGVLQTRGVDYTISFAGGYVWINFTKPPPLGAEIKVLFSVNATAQHVGPGMYYLWYNGAWEWIIVGRDSDPVDSIGAAMVSEYFLEKGTPVMMSALDMQDIPYHPKVPFVFAKLGIITGFAGEDMRGSRDAYRDNALGPNTGRTAVKDDWCKHLPVSSANIIVVGGPLANLGAEYMNDFAEAFYGIPGLTHPDYSGKLISLTCWSKNAYSGEGYAVIATHKDLNGTVWFEVWGMTGQDTYYATWWLWRTYYGYRMMDILPPGVTALVLSFDYSLHPTEPCFWKVKETLGTISEVNLQNLPAFNVGWPVEKLPTIHPDP